MEASLCNEKRSKPLNCSLMGEYADKMHDLSERWAGGLFGYQSDMWLNCLAR